ncbi:hypothetical protein AX17_005099 [Amanita inopinata Kibby_2008]|nr:hypothetical protein AX17_005099 [Amanita inopinata Kibby_2008]
MTDGLPSYVIFATMLFAVAILSVLGILFFALYRSAPRITRRLQNDSHDAESSRIEAESGSPTGFYKEYGLGHELPQNRSYSFPNIKSHRLPPLIANKGEDDGEDSCESLTPTASHPVIFGHGDRTMGIVHVTVTPPTPAKRKRAASLVDGEE